MGASKHAFPIVSASCIFLGHNASRPCIGCLASQLLIIAFSALSCSIAMHYCSSVSKHMHKGWQMAEILSMMWPTIASDISPSHTAFTCIADQHTLHMPRGGCSDANYEESLS